MENPFSPGAPPRPRGSVDPRVAMVLEVLGGTDAVEVAHRWSVEIDLLRRWVRSFVEAGDAVVTNRPRARAAQERDRFLSAFAHELRTPLTAAQTWTELLRGDDAGPDLSERGLAALDTALGRLATRVREIELLAAASLGRVELSLERVRLDELVAPLRPGLEVELAAGATQVVVDPEKFRHVVDGLLRAALLPPTPRSVKLEASTVGPWTEIRVVREAEPIAPQLLHALLEPFSAENLNADGTGFTTGLYLARALTTAHGGTIGLEQDDGHLAVWVRVPSSPQLSPHDAALPAPAATKVASASGPVGEAIRKTPALAPVTHLRPRTDETSSGARR